MVYCKFISSWFSTLYADKRRFPGLAALANGTSRQQCIFVNAINVLGVNAGIRPACLFVGYMFGPAVFHNGERSPLDDDAPTRTSKDIAKRLVKLIRRYCPNVHVDVPQVLQDEAVVHMSHIAAFRRVKDMDQILQSKTCIESQVAKLLGYIGGQEGPGAGALSIEIGLQFKIPGIGTDKGIQYTRVRLYSWDANISNEATGRKLYKVCKLWDHLASLNVA